MPAVLIALGVVALLALIFLCWWISTANGFKRSRIKISEALSGIEVSLTKRYDMLTKMLDVAKGFTKHETELFTQVIELRRGMSIAELNNTSGQLDALAGRINVVAENYPELRSADVFRDLQAGIRDAEQHLQASRRLYNSTVTTFNTAIEVFPSSMVAKSKGLQKHEFFVAEAYKRDDVKMSF